jgi:hypothetical protein
MYWTCILSNGESLGLVEPYDVMREMLHALRKIACLKDLKKQDIRGKFKTVFPRKARCGLPSAPDLF